jgi:acetyl esterase
VIANLDVYEPSCRALCNAAEAIVVSVAYRQAPEHKYPAAVEDSYAATQWIMNNAAQIGGDPARIAISGESAGGNLATVVCQIIKENGGQMPLAQLLVYPLRTRAAGILPTTKTPIPCR